LGMWAVIFLQQHCIRRIWAHPSWLLWPYCDSPWVQATRCWWGPNSVGIASHGVQSIYVPKNLDLQGPVFQLFQAKLHCCRQKGSKMAQAH
jgi:hypothetical protein